MEANHYRFHPYYIPYPVSGGRCGRLGIRVGSSHPQPHTDLAKKPVVYDVSSSSAIFLAMASLRSSALARIAFASA